MDFIKILQNRYSTKVFDANKKLSEEDIYKIKESLQLSISSGNTQPWHFIIASGDKKNELALKTPASNLKKIQDASHLLVFCSKKYNKCHVSNLGNGLSQSIINKKRLSYMQTMWENIIPQSDFWVEKQVYLASGMFVVSCAALGIDSCMMEGFDSVGFSDVLGLKEDTKVVLICALRFRSAEDFNSPDKSPKWRLPQSQIITEI